MHYFDKWKPNKKERKKKVFYISNTKEFSFLFVHRGVAAEAAL
jgi:hypothetical protein